MSCTIANLLARLPCKTTSSKGLIRKHVHSQSPCSGNLISVLGSTLTHKPTGHQSIQAVNPFPIRCDVESRWFGTVLWWAFENGREEKEFATGKQKGFRILHIIQILMLFIQPSPSSCSYSYICMLRISARLSFHAYNSYMIPFLPWQRTTLNAENPSIWVNMLSMYHVLMSMFLVLTWNSSVALGFRVYCSLIDDSACSERHWGWSRIGGCLERKRLKFHFHVTLVLKEIQCDLMVE